MNHRESSRHLFYEVNIMRKQTILALLLCLIVTFAMTGCVKVVEIGKEDELTGNKKFNAAENVEGL